MLVVQDFLRFHSWKLCWLKRKQNPHSISKMGCWISFKIHSCLFFPFSFFSNGYTKVLVWSSEMINYYLLIYSNCYLHLDCYSQCFGYYTHWPHQVPVTFSNFFKIQTKPIIQSLWVDCSHSTVHSTGYLILVNLSLWYHLFQSIWISLHWPQDWIHDYQVNILILKSITTIMWYKLQALNLKSLLIKGSFLVCSVLC